MVRKQVRSEVCVSRNFRRSTILSGTSQHELPHYALSPKPRRRISFFRPSIVGSTSWMPDRGKDVGLGFLRCSKSSFRGLQQSLVSSNTVSDFFTLMGRSGSHQKSRQTLRTKISTVSSPPCSSVLCSRTPLRTDEVRNKCSFYEPAQRDRLSSSADLLQRHTEAKDYAKPGLDS